MSEERDLRKRQIEDIRSEQLGSKVVMGKAYTDLGSLTNIVKPNEHMLRDAAAFLLESTCDLDTQSPHGRRTPERFVRMLQELTTPKEFEFTTFPAETDEMITVADIPFVSLCNHHIIPFMGRACVGYIPDKFEPGLSKVARVVQYYAASLQTQERLTAQIAERLWLELNPLGVAVVLKAEHFCMTIRGAQVPGAITTTAKMMGVFEDHSRTAKMEFMQGVK